MSVKLVEREIRRFLASADSEVACLTGRWGVGKTYAWNTYLGAAKSGKKIALKRYSYVSLFGVKSLDELKYPLFENSVDASEIGVEPSLESVRSNTIAVAKRLGRKSLPFLSLIPKVKDYAGILGPLGFLTVRETVVCIDDIERRGDGLKMRDVMGLVSLLKEQKKCKVMLILNDDALDESESADFHKFHEKVVDASLRFEPSPQECVDIAVSKDTSAGQLLAENCVLLGVSNIRVIKKIERSVRAVEESLREYDDLVFRQAVQTITLFTWSIYSPGEAPTIEYLKSRNKDFLELSEEKELSEKEAAWNALLDAYNFSNVDELDLALLQGIENGFFDYDTIRKHALGKNETIKKEKLNQSFREAWNMYHDSFDDNSDQVLDAIYAAFQNSVHLISPVSLNGTVGLFKALGRTEQAAEMIKRYFDSNSENLIRFRLQDYPFAANVRDPDVVKAYNEHIEAHKTMNKADPVETLLRMAEVNGWSPDDITLLSTLPIEDYYEIFKSRRGDELRQILNVCLQFERIGNSSSDMLEISRRAREALQRIGQQSPINAQRVSKYGINIEPPSPAESS